MIVLERAINAIKSRSVCGERAVKLLRNSGEGAKRLSSSLRSRSESTISCTQQGKRSGGGVSQPCGPLKKDLFTLQFASSLR